MKQKNNKVNEKDNTKDIEKEDSNKKIKVDKTNQKSVLEEEKKEVNESIDSIKPINKSRKKLYFDYNARLTLLIIFFVIFFILSIFLFSKSFFVEHDESFEVQENGDIDYKVFLKENNIYEQAYLEKGKSYVAALIKNINVLFKYNLNFNKESDVTLDYKVVGNLIIEDEANDKVFYEKQFDLLDKKDVTLSAIKNYEIAEEIDIDYDYYNNIANSFKNSYSVSAVSKFVVTFEVSRKNLNSENDIGVNSNSMDLTIPLSKRSINIDLSTSQINNNKKYAIDQNIIITSYLLLSLFVVSVIVTLYIFYKANKYAKMLFVKKTNYDKYITKILTDYDRLIVETQNMIKLDDYNVFRVRNFDELLDARDNFKNPIMYYNVTNHVKCHFYLKDHDDVYLLTIKAVDLENEK